MYNRFESVFNVILLYILRITSNIFNIITPGTFFINVNNNQVYIPVFYTIYENTFV
jgi:hypothetical protein